MIFDNTIQQGIYDRVGTYTALDWEESAAGEGALLLVRASMVYYVFRYHRCGPAELLLQSRDRGIAQSKFDSEKTNLLYL